MACPVPAKRIADFENMGFGVFVHWGLYSQLNKGEWVKFITHIPDEEYQKLQNTFTAKDFDARHWAKVAHDAGAKYMVLTTRHHEGFSLFDTMGMNTYDAPHSPVGRDLVREYVDACREFGLVPFFYHTTLDWYNKDFDGDWKKYLQYLRDSVEILCTRYGKIGGLWFDGNWSRPNNDWEEAKLYEVIRKHQPDAIIVNNTGVFHRGEMGEPEIDSVTFEQGRAEPMNREGAQKYLAAEMCHTMNDHWGVGECDLNYKSLPELIETLAACRKVGANYLLNMGPTGEGAILPLQEALLTGIGTWIHATGDRIYEAKPYPMTGEGKDFVMQWRGKILFFVHDLKINSNPNVTIGCGAGTPKRFSGKIGKIRRIHWTDIDEELPFTQDAEGVTVTCSAYPYGRNLVVRIAEAELE